MNIYKLEERVLFEAAGAVEAVKTAEDPNQHTSTDKNQSESENREQEAKETAQNAGPTQTESPQTPLSEQKQELPGANAWDNLPDAIRDLQSNPEYNIQHLPNEFERNLESFLQSDSSQNDIGKLHFQELFPEHRELIIINSSVTDTDSILENRNENTDVLYLKEGENALSQINSYLDSKGDVRYDAIHLVSHGNKGFFVLNGKSVDLNSVQENQTEWENIGKHISEEGDLLIYGCNLAESEAGKQLVTELSDITGADVAASVNRTGLNGDSELEYKYGSIETFSLNFDSYEHSLTAYTVTNDADSGDGSLRQAILDANSDPGGGEIIFKGDYTITLKNELLITDSLTISGTGINRTVILVEQPGLSNWRAFHITSGDIQFSDLTIQGGKVDYGAGISVEGGGTSFTMNRVLLENGNGGVSGGGLYAKDSTVSIYDSTIYGNMGGGIGIDGGASLNLLNSTVTGNNGGGVVILNGTGNLVNNIIAGNNTDLIAGESGVLRGAYNFYGNVSGRFENLGGNVAGATVRGLFGNAIPQPDGNGTITPNDTSIAIGNGTMTGIYNSKDVFFDFTESAWKYIDGSSSSDIIPSNVTLHTGDQTATDGMRGSYYVTAGSIDFNISGASYNAQSSGGNWNSATTWQAQFAYGGGGTSGWIGMNNHTPDTGNSNTITITSGSNVTITQDIHADQLNIALGGTLTITNGVNLILDDGTDNDLVNNGTLIVTGNILLNDSATWNNETGSTVSFNGLNQTINGGTYYNLSISVGTDPLGGDVTVNGTFTCTNTIITGNANLILNGTVSGNGTVAMSGGSVRFTNNTNIFAGTYYDLEIAGSASGLSGDVNVVHTFDAGNQMITLNNHTLTLGGDVLNLNLLTPGSGSVVYNGQTLQTVAGLTYYNLILSGNGGNVLGGNITVSGTFTNTSVLSGNADLILNGSVTGNGTMNLTGGTAFYNTSQTIFGGVYYNLTAGGGVGTTLTAPNAFTVTNILNIGTGMTLNLSAVDYSGASIYQWNSSKSVLTGAVLYSASGVQTILVDSYEGGLQLSGGTKQFLAGVYQTGAEIVINTPSSITLNGAGVGQTILSVLNPGISTNRVLNVNNGVLFVNDMHIRGGDVSGSGANGGAILSNQGILALSRVTVSDGKAVQGGGIYLGSSTLYIGDCTVFGNSATGSGGGIYFASGSINMVNTTIAGNNAGISGGGLYAGGVSSNIANSILAGNTRSGSGVADDFYRAMGTYYVTHSMFGTVSGGFVPVTDTNWLNASPSDIFLNPTPVLNPDGTIHLNSNSIAIGNGTRVGGYAQKYVFFDYTSGSWKYLDGSDSSGINPANVNILTGDALGVSGRRGNYFVTVGALDYNIQGAAWQSNSNGDWSTASVWKSVFSLGDGSFTLPVLMRNHTPDTSNSGNGITVSHSITLSQNLTISGITIAAAGNLTVNPGITLTLGNGNGDDLQNAGTLTLGGNVAFSTGATWLHNTGSTVIYNGTAQTIIAGNYYNLTLDGSGNKTLAGAVHTINDFNAGNQNVVIGTNTLTLSGNVLNFTQLATNTGNVVYDGANQNIAALTYYNLTLLGGINYFQAGQQTTVNGTFLIHGTNTALAQIGSTTPGTQWILVLGSGAVTDIAYVSVSDANSNRLIALNSNNLSGGNNTNWTITVDLSGVSGGNITFGDKLGTVPLTGNAIVWGGTVVPGSFIIANPNTLPQVSDSGLTHYSYTFKSNSDPTYVGGGTFTITVLPKTVTVAVSAGQGKSYGNPDPTLTYQITSGALIGGDTFTGSLTRQAGETVGSYDISKGTLALNSNYTLTVLPGGIFTISARNVTVTINSTGKTYGDPDPTLTYQITSGSLVSGDSFTGSILRATGENVGIYGIVQNTLGLNSNYKLTVVPGVFTISPRAIEVTGSSGTKIYGNSDPVFGYTITNGSLVSGDSITGNVLRAIGENAGSYLVGKGTLSLSSNYTLTYKTGTFVITPRAIEITARNAGKIYGNDDPTLLWSITNGELIGTDSLSGALLRNPGENAGIYSINQGTLSAGNNYSVTFKSGSFTIQQRAVTVVLNDASKTYGDTDPGLTCTVVKGLIMSGDSFSGNPVRGTGENAGSYTISQGTLTLGSNYILTVQGNAVFTITQRYVEVSANASGKTYGNADPVLGYTIVSGSLATGDSFTGAITRTNGENAGTYVISQGTLALNNNYALRFDNGTFTIAPRIIQVAANNLSKVYGDADPILSYTVTGSLVGGDSFTGALARDAGKNVGSYTINQGTLALNSNYTLTFTSGTLSVTPRPITITADNVYKLSSLAPDPALTWYVTNLIPGDTYTGSLSADPVTHVISIGTLSYGSNYAQTFVTGNVIINAKVIVSVTIDDAAKIYGNNDPTFNLTVSGLLPTYICQYTFTRTAGENVGEYRIFLSSFKVLNGVIDITNTFNISIESGYLTISPRPVTVTPDSGQGKVYDGNSNSSIKYTVTGALGSDTVSFGGSLAQNGRDVGNYNITQGNLYSTNGNYSINFVNGIQYGIAQRNITVSANSQSKIYGDADPTLTWNIVSGNLVAGDSLSGTLSRIGGNDVGTYTISQNTLTAGSNYAITFNSALLSITPRELIVTVTPGQSKQYDGTSNATINYAYSNTAYGETNLLAGTLIQQGIDAGTYQVKVGTLHSINTNYTFRLNAGTYQILLREITITSDSVSKIYGYADPELTWKVTSGSIIPGDIVDGTLSRISGEDVNTYAIIQGNLHIDYNYNITFVGNTFTINQRSILVTANNTGKVYGNSDPTLGYTIATGSLAFSDTFSGALTRAIGNDVGTYAITQGTLSLNTNYRLDFANGTFTITPRPITVTADNKTKVYGDTDPGLTWQVTGGSGLVSGDTLTGSLTRTGNDHAGVYAILQGSLNNSNYNITFVAGVFTITQRSITVTADSGQSKVYGNSNPNYTWQVTQGELRHGDTLYGSLARNSGENVGNYTLTQGTLHNDDYNITFVGASFAITPRPITVAPDAGQGKIYGYSDPTLTWSLVAGNMVGSDKLSGSISRQVGENTGTYAITQGTLANSNYAITFLSTGFVISPRPITIGADAGQSKIYGYADPILTWTLLNGQIVSGDTFSGALGRAPGENTGSYAINKGTFSNSNYTITFFGSNFTINRRPVTVTATGGQGKIYGNSDPTLTWQITEGALVSGDTLSGSLTRTAGENTGGYTIGRGNLSNSNYSITYVAGTFTITPRPITVSPTAGQGKTYGNADQTLTWQITAGNLVGSDSLNGELSRAAGENAGSYAISKNTLANSNYAITFISNNYTISPRPIAIGATAGQGKIYGNTDPTFVWQLLSGNFIGSDTLSGTLSRDAGENTGSYAFHLGTLANSNYAVTFVNGNPFVITGRAVTVTVNNGQGKIYGDTDPASLNWMITSGSLLSGDALSGALLRATGENAGSYLISQGTLNNTNYAITFVSANFTISPRPITVTADSGKTKVYGTPSDPVFTWKITSGGLLGSDTLSGILGRIPGENAGSYAITQGSLANNNYAITFVSNPFIITQCPITITPDSGQNKIYGNNDPTFTYKITTGSL